MKSTKKPNLFIVGAMKCGTTILTDYLCKHRDIAIGRNKEVHYFSLYDHLGEEWYLDQFKEAHGPRYLLDSSPTYFDTALWASVPSRIKAFSPDAKIIVLVRDPLVRAVSHFHHLRTVNEVPSLQAMSAAEFLSRDWKSALVRYSDIDRLLFNVLNFSAFFAKICEYTNVFGRENVLVVSNEDLRGSGQECMDQIFDFLDLPGLSSPFFSSQNYVTKSEKGDLPLGLTVDFYKAFGEDYYHSYKSPMFNRVSVSSMNEPAGAIVGDVAIGKDGWLFLAGGSNDVTGLFKNDDGNTDALIRQWHNLVARRQVRLTERGCKYLHCFIPEKISIYGDKLGWPISHAQSPGYRFNNEAPDAIRENVLDIFSYFLSIKDDYLLYHKTDSHWSHLGAFVAYQLICSALGMSPRSDLLRRPMTNEQALFDLGSKLPYPVREEAAFAHFAEEAVLTDEGDMVRFKKSANRENDISLHVGSMVTFHNESAPHKKRALLFGDSFSEYRDHLLTGLLAETFSDFMFVWSTSIDFNIVDEFAPDIVLTAHTERFMKKTPDDTLDIQAYIKATLAKFQQETTQ